MNRVLVPHLGEAPVVVGDHGGVGAVQLLDDLEALVELSEDVHHRAGEQSVLRRLLELQAEGGEDNDVRPLFTFIKTSLHLHSAASLLHRLPLLSCNQIITQTILICSPSCCSFVLCNNSTDFRPLQSLSFTGNVAGLGIKGLLNCCTNHMFLQIHSDGNGAQRVPVVVCGS